MGTLPTKMNGFGSCPHLEMNSVELSHIHGLDHNEECVEETSSDHLLSSSSLDIYDIHGDTSVPPRLGDQYQAEIPSLLSESERLLFRHCPTNTGDMLGASFSIGVGLPIPITSVFRVDGLIKHTQQEFISTSVSADTDLAMGSMNNKESQFDSICCSVTGYPISHDTLPLQPNCEVEFSNGPLENCHEFARTTSKEHLTLDDPMDIDLTCMQLKKEKDCIPFTDSPAVSWSDYEIQSFILGLYIFGKNLVQVRKFVGSKKMGDVLSYYYGGFYKSDAYRRWAELRKMRGKKCIDGQRIFTGPRQQKLLSRMLPFIPKEVQDNLLEAAKSFSEGVSSLEEFVFTLKAMVGMELFVEAVGIGKGKHDLTGAILGPTRSKKVIPMHPQIPVGKGYSSFTSGDIIKFLTGGFRLSKAKSNDLFWEAVWPRLLARGWHSEQPEYLSSVDSRNAIVFLIPGINKFLKKKHTKGDHYFDSVSDVLKKLASDPMLLELHSEGAKVRDSYNNKNKWDADVILDQNGPSDQQSHCDLRPGLPNNNSQLVKFTIVDTSLFQGEGPFKVRELQSFPVDASRSYRPSKNSVDTDIKSYDQELTGSDVSPNDLENSASDISIHNKFGNSKKCNIGKGMQYEPSSHFVSVSKRKLATDTKDGVLNNKQLIKAVKCKLSRGLKSDKSTYLSPALKKKRLTGCKYKGGYLASSSKDYQLNKEDAHLKQKSVELNEIMGEKSTSCSVKGSPDKSSECNSHVYLSGSSDISAAVLSQDKQPPNTLIDLNILQFPVDFDIGEPIYSNMAGIRDGFNTKELALKSSTNQKPDAPQHSDASNGVPSTQHPINNGWRQSTRNRPPTTRALEAFACGFLSTKRKGKGPKTLHQMS